jgi:hypothetical protein
VTRKDRDEVLVAASACTSIGEDVEKRTTDVSEPSHRNLVAAVHDARGRRRRLGRAVEKIARAA